MENNALATISCANGVVIALRENGTDGWIDDILDSITYCPESGFNGVLIILREPGGEENYTEDEWRKAVEGNRDWFKEILGKKHSQYRKRFDEMLRFIGKDPDDLEHAAYANIKCIPGGSSASKEYKKIKSENKRYRVKDIIEALTEKYKSENAPVTHVFMCNDIFKAVFPGWKSTEGGIKYNKGGRRKYKRDDKSGVNYYEIYHPSYWSASISDES